MSRRSSASPAGLVVLVAVGAKTVGEVHCPTGASRNGKVTPIEEKRREKERAVATQVAKGWGRGWALGAAAVVAALLLVFVVVKSVPTPATAAQIDMPSPVTNYMQGMWSVRFSQSVTASSAEANTQ